MKEVLMDAAAVSSIVLAFVGLIKLPFSKFKTKHPKCFRFTFFFLSLALSGALSVLVQLYLVCGSLLSTEFVMLVISTLAFVFGGYSTYENTSLKALVKKIVSACKSLGNKHSESKAVKKVEKLIDKVGKEKIEEILYSVPENK